MVVGTLEFKLHLPDVHSLKEKRAVERFVWSFPEVEVVDSSLRWMETE